MLLCRARKIEIAAGEMSFLRRVACLRCCLLAGTSWNAPRLVFPSIFPDTGVPECERWFTCVQVQPSGTAAAPSHYCDSVLLGKELWREDRVGSVYTS